MSQTKAYLDIVYGVLKRQRLIKVFAMVILLLVGFAFWMSQLDEPSSVARVLSIIFLALGFVLNHQVFKSFKLKSSPIYITLSSEVKQVVWVHHHITQVMPFGIHLFERYTLFIYLLDGRELQLVGKKKEVLALISTLEGLCSQASFGYSVEKEQLFKANPALLLRDD